MAVLSKGSSSPFVVHLNAKEFEEFQNAKADPEELKALKKMADALKKNIIPEHTTRN